jgi:hypothetical protein
VAGLERYPFTPASVSELPAEVGEAGGVLELAPALSRVKVGKGEKEIDEAAALAPEHGSQLVRLCH